MGSHTGGKSCCCLLLYCLQFFISMGGCFSFWQKPDLTGSTFSHYSLESHSETLDLYPGFRYIETDGSMSEEGATTWRRSSEQLLETGSCHKSSLIPSSSFSRSTNSQSESSGGNVKLEENNTTSKSFNFKCNKDLVKLRKTMKLKSFQSKKNSDSIESTDTDNEKGGSARDSGETVVEEFQFG